METTDRQYRAPYQGDEQEDGQPGDVAATGRSLVPMGHAAGRSVAPELEAEIAAAQAAMAVCKTCSGAGWLARNVPYGHPNFGKPYKCDCRLALERVKRKRDIMKLSSLGEVRDKTLKGFNTRAPGVQEAVKVARAYASNPDGWLVFLGPSGCGKTHLAAAIANTCFDELGMVVLFVTVADLLDHLRATFAPNSPMSYDEQFARLRDADLLVLDDLGAQHTTDWAREKLFQLINYRYNQAGAVDERTRRRKAATVVTSNLFDLNGVEERIRSRLYDVSISEVVGFGRNVQDYRPHKRPPAT